MRQLTIVSSNHQDLVTDISRILARENIDFKHIDSHLVDRYACVKLVVSDYHLSLRRLTEAGFDAVSDDSVLLRVDDKPGALARLSRKIADLGIATRAITMLHHENEHIIAAISTDNNPRVREQFQDSLIS